MRTYWTHGGALPAWWTGGWTGVLFYYNRFFFFFFFCRARCSPDTIIALCTVRNAIRPVFKSRAPIDLTFLVKKIIITIMIMINEKHIIIIIRRRIESRCQFCQFLRARTIIYDCVGMYRTHIILSLNAYVYIARTTYTPVGIAVSLPGRILDVEFRLAVVNSAFCNRITEESMGIARKYRGRSENNKSIFSSCRMLTVSTGAHHIIFQIILQLNRTKEKLFSVTANAYGKEDVNVLTSCLLPNSTFSYCRRS